MIYIYAIRSIKSGWTYVGQTQNVIVRFHQHNNGEEKTTKPYTPFELIYTKECADRLEARKYEKYFKSGEGRKYLHSLKF